MKDYHINIFYSQEEAKALWLEAARLHGKPVPEPRYRPFIYQVGV